MVSLLSSTHGIRRVPFYGLLFIASVFLPWGADAQSPENSVTPPIIDVHTHFIGRPKMFPGAIKAAKSLMDRYGVEKTIVSHVPSNDGRVMYNFKALTNFLQGKERFAFLGGGGSLNPMIHRHDANSREQVHLVEEFTSKAKAILNVGGAGFGEMASLHISLIPGHLYEYQPADHPLFLRLADIAAENDVPIDLHMDAVRGSMETPKRFSHGGNPGAFPGTIKALERLLQHNPRAKISWAHGGTDPLGEMTPKLIGSLMDKYGNLYMSMRIGDKRSRKMRNFVFDGDELDQNWLALLKRHSDRFFIGTDAVFVSAQMPKRGAVVKFSENNSTTYELTRTFLSMLPKDLAAKVANENARRVYRLQPQGRRTTALELEGTQKKKEFLTEAEIHETVIGNTISFKAPSNGRPLLIYFGEDGRVDIKVVGSTDRIISKKWFIKGGKMLCRTFGRQNKNHCTLVSTTPTPNTVLMFNKKLNYEARLLQGRQLSE